MNEVLAGLLFKVVVAYFNDLLIFPDTKEELQKNTELVMSRLAKYRLKINLEKSSFEKDEVKFLGNTIFGVGKRVSSSRVCAVEHFPTPTSLTALRSFLGLINFYRGFIPNCSSLLAPLFAVLKAYPWSSLYWRWFCCS